MDFGRRQIYTDVKEVNKANIVEIVRKVFPTHQANAGDIDFLLNYEAGYQPLQRVKTYRKDINAECVDNVANEVTEFNLGFKWGYPITLVQRGEKDSGVASENDAIALLNEYYDSENIKAKTQQIGRFVEICGVGYSYISRNSEYVDGESLFKIEVLDPRYAFVIRSMRYIDNRVMVSVTFRTDENGKYYFTCFTPSQRFEIDGDSWAITSVEPNRLKMHPIVEWIRAYDRMGCFERQIPEMDNLNLLVSDFTNDVDQNTQCLWHSNDIEFPKELVDDGKGGKIEKVKKPGANEWVMTYTSPEGRTPFINPLSVAYDYQGMLNNILSRRSLILQKCNVPQRNDNSGGSTGIAMSDATGWSAAESSACKQQNIMEMAKMDEVRVVLQAIRENPLTPVDSPILNLRAIDIAPSIKRSKSYELTSKANAFATLVSHGIYGLHALNTVNLFEDVNQVWADSKDMVQKFQDKTFGDDEVSDRLQADNSDQVENSPMLN